MADLTMVKMQDGREVKFGARMKMRKEVLDNGAQVRFDFPNGQTRLVDAKKIHETCQPLVFAHGLAQKIGDESASLDTVAQCIKATDDMIARLYDGSAFVRQGGGGFQDTTLIQALIEVGAAEQEARELVKGLSTAERLALRATPELKAIVERLEAEKAGQVDTAAILGKLGILK